ncbi:alpha-hydroxy-acid oxidizing protein, partial [Rhizobium brockwellii]
MTIRSGNTDRSTRLCRDVLCLDDLEIKARRHLPKPLFGNISGATETNASLRQNAEAF